MFSSADLGNSNSRRINSSYIPVKIGSNFNNCLIIPNLFQLLLIPQPEAPAVDEEKLIDNAKNLAKRKRS